MQSSSPTQQPHAYNAELAARIDHTLLKPDMTRSQVAQLCQEAEQYGFAAVCIPPSYVKYARKQLKKGKSKVGVATVVGFPLGYSTTTAKMLEIIESMRKGATEIDMVIHIGAVKDKRWNYVSKEIKQAAALTHHKKAILKVIIETGLLTNEEVVQLCQICTAAKVDFVKTSTGFSGGGATPEVVMLMRRSLPDRVQIKASGGIRTLAQAQALVAAGADRLGCSQSVAIVTTPADKEPNDLIADETY